MRRKELIGIARCYPFPPWKPEASLRAHVMGAHHHPMRFECQEQRVVVESLGAINDRPDARHDNATGATPNRRDHERYQPEHLKAGAGNDVDDIAKKLCPALNLGDQMRVSTSRALRSAARPARARVSGARDGLRGRRSELPTYRLKGDRLTLMDAPVLEGVEAVSEE